jgi:hypothetical protein
VQKYGRTRQDTDDGMVRVHCMLDNKGYRHTLTLCNTYCFSNATMAARTRLDVTLYVHWRSCLITLPIAQILWLLLNNTLGTWSFPEVKRPGRGVDTSSYLVKERV